jgi:hypothetical protein
VRHAWENNIKTNLRETGYECVNWFQVAQDMVQWLIFENRQRAFELYKRTVIHYPLCDVAFLKTEFLCRLVTDAAMQRQDTVLPLVRKTDHLTSHRKVIICYPS